MDFSENGVQPCAFKRAYGGQPQWPAEEGGAARVIPACTSGFERWNNVTQLG